MIDPLCKLVTEVTDGHYRGLHFRLCMAVCGPLDMALPRPHQCHRRKVAFASAEALERPPPLRYERMALCECTSMSQPLKGEPRNEIYVSRAYMSNQVFIYRKHPTSRKYYAVDLLTDVSIVDEVNSLDFPED